ncbi:hypothetical protein AbraCBS73388_000772, partial [Aspergillus brasiliensis]
MGHPSWNQKPIPPKVPRDTELKPSTAQVGWTTNLLHKKNEKAHYIVREAFEPVFLKAELGPAIYKYATSDGQAIAET